MANGLDIRRVEYNPMYRARKHIAKAQDYMDTQRQVTDAQDARKKQSGLEDALAFVGSLIGSVAGPGGAAIGAGIGHGLGDLWYSDWLPGENVEDIKIDPSLFNKSRVEELNAQLALADEMGAYEHIAAGAKAGATAWTLGEAANIGGFKAGFKGGTWDKLWEPLWDYKKVLGI